MYEQFLADPSSVDPAWHDFFADYKPTQRAAGVGDNVARTTAPASTGGSTTTVKKDTTPPPKTTQPPAKEAPTRANGQVPTEATRSAVASGMSTTGKPAPSQAAKAAPVKKAAGEQVSPLRGAAAAIAKNMQQSLALPTATSVRAVPAKLLSDNRIVINNHPTR